MPGTSCVLCTMRSLARDTGLAESCNRQRMLPILEREAMKIRQRGKLEDISPDKERKWQEGVRERLVPKILDSGLG